MCGVVGYWRIRPSHRHDDDKLSAAIRYISHRGPEGTTILREDDLAVAHCHLTFHQPGISDQPYRSPCRNYIIAFNGEIYNYSDLRSELEYHGHIFDSYSEAELIFLCYRHYGLKFAERLRGMFAIVLRDKVEDTLVLCRDFIGKKPLFYKRDKDTIFFSSELTGLNSFLSSNDLDGPAFTSFFLINAVDSRLCLLSNASKVAPGELVILSANDDRRISYWTPQAIRQRNGSYDTVERLSGLLRQAVKRRLLNNGTSLGLMLSGGLDSSLVAAFAAAEGHTLPSYTVSFNDSGFDESQQAARVAALFGAEHNVVELNDGLVVGLMERLFSTVDEPIADPSFLGIAAVAEVAKGHVKGLLTGDGADDLFAGYSFFKVVRALTIAHHIVPSSLLAFFQRICTSLPDREGNLNLRMVAQLLSRGLRVGPAWQHAFSTSAFTSDELVSILTPEARSLAGWPFTEEISQGGSSLQEARLGILRTFLQGPILTKLDRGAMASGVELRNPFLDQDVADFALSLSMGELVDGSKTKVRLRQVARQWLPPDVCDRPKRGFRLPTQRLLRGPARELLLDTLSEAALQRGGLFDVRAVESLLNQHLVDGFDRSKQLWSLLAFNLWHQRKTGASGPSVTPLQGLSCVA